MHFITFGKTRQINLDIGSTITYESTNANLNISNTGLVSVISNVTNPTTIFINAKDNNGNSRFIYSFMIVPSSFNLSQITNENGEEKVALSNMVGPLV